MKLKLSTAKFWQATERDESLFPTATVEEMVTFTVEGMCTYAEWIDLRTSLENKEYWAAVQEEAYEAMKEEA